MLLVILPAEMLKGVAVIPNMQAAFCRTLTQFRFTVWQKMAPRAGENPTLCYGLKNIKNNDTKIVGMCIVC